MRGTITVFVNGRTNQFFYSTDHCQFFLDKSIDLRDWIPITFQKPETDWPMLVAPRPELPTGEITNKQEYEMIFHYDEKEIPNPNTKFQANWD